MTEESEVLFNYKGIDIIVKKTAKGYHIGIRDKIDIWVESVLYNTIELVKTSGMEYARILIDKMLLVRKGESKKYVKTT